MSLVSSLELNSCSYFWHYWTLSRSKDALCTPSLAELAIAGDTAQVKF